MPPSLLWDYFELLSLEWYVMDELNAGSISKIKYRINKFKNLYKRLELVSYPSSKLVNNYIIDWKRRRYGSLIRADLSISRGGG